jgi:hypothetical protein
MVLMITAEDFRQAVVNSRHTMDKTQYLKDNHIDPIALLVWSGRAGFGDPGISLLVGFSVGFELAKLTLIREGLIPTPAPQEPTQAPRESDDDLSDPQAPDS